MFIKIDFTSDMPIYEQIKNQIIEGIARGELQNGDSLPSIRDLASEIGVNMHTVAKAYNELKDMGLIAVNKKHGAYIAVSKGYDKEFLNEMMEELTPIVAKAICKGMNKNELIRLIETIFDSFGGREDE
ncbi:GntR family transcriptional regulator [Caldicellulosiruptor changbaiensis]|uniref:GntR family transcriptional regulator n=1 Tax=Caldicellulosiruptor changbaiensis TaxID=1222016 RepID=A0A3T0D2F3_9FIRM|nr:GntR family transcriptional regulator [Caldicellulosiruptor changbaiensis]AZT89417.1 GntR family transcriptional regulator [Caldicellulosiruptor changbaiensis]